MTNEYERSIAEARRDYNRMGGVEPLNGCIEVPWRTKKDLSIWLMYLAYVFPLKAEPSIRYTDEQIVELVQKEWGISRSTYYNYLSIMKERGWFIPEAPMTQWEQSCYLNGPKWQAEREALQITCE